VDNSPPPHHAGGRWPAFLWPAGAAIACTLAGFAMEERFDRVNIAMVYLLAVVIAALRFSRPVAIATAVACMLAFDYFFVPPKRAFVVDDFQYLLTFTIMLVVAIVISKLTEDIRGQAQKRAELETSAEAERIRSALLASVSHDLRTPLAVMSGASSTLAEAADDLDPEERRALARGVFEQSVAMSEQVAKVLQMTRLETGSITLARDWNSIADLAGAVLGRLAQRLARHRVMTDFPADLPLVRVDAALIDQVLSNLVENAAKYTPEGTLIRLRANVEDGRVVVSIEDYGGGLPIADFEKIFAKFERGRAEGKVGGAGLGLSICRAIVMLHGGKIWAQQLAGGGTAFRFTLPLEAVPSVPVESQ
jgi:two-component system sensor histidine kinase KdpD